MSTTIAVLGDFGDAIDFLFNERESPAGGARVGGLSETGELIWEHLKLSGVAMSIACATRLPLRETDSVGSPSDAR